MNLNPISGIIDSAGSLFGKIFGDKAARETNIHDEQKAAFNAFQAENASQRRENRTWWDSFVDGLNRLPRPLFAFAVMGVFVWAPLDPISFGATMAAYALIPQWLTFILGQIILLYFGGRMMEKFNTKGPSVKQIKETLNTISEIKSLRAISEQVPVQSVEPVIRSPYEQVPGRMGNDEFEVEMKNTKVPLSLPAIVEWNRRRKDGE